MAFSRIAENRIREAMREGRFDSLPARGALDLEEYFKLPPELRMAYSILKSAGLVPEEVELLREIDRLQDALAKAAEPAKPAIRESLAAVRLKLDVALERTRRQRVVTDAPSPR